ncbi:hypothetical protein BCV71DRAFT_277900, partial [Rhizopus microsporus]
DSKNILAIGNLVWRLKNLQATLAVIKQVKQEYDDYETGKMDRISLQPLVNLNIKRPVKCAQYGILLSIEKDGGGECLLR